MILTDHLRGKRAELDNPPVNSIGYQESVVPEAGMLPDHGGHPLLVPDIVAEPPIELQGERPEMDADFYTEARTAFDIQDGRPKDQGGGWDSPDLLSVPPDPSQQGSVAYPLVAGFPGGLDGVWDTPLGEGAVKTSGGLMTEYEKLAAHVRDAMDSSCNDRACVEATYRSLAASVAKQASDKGLASDPGRIRIASLDQLFAFKAVGASQLIHKATKDLWKVSLDEDGHTVIAREFDASGSPLQD